MLVPRGPACGRRRDDGKLSLEEFQLFFADGVLNEKELEDLFHTIDSDNTNHVDTKELCDYFVEHMGDYEDVLASLETLNHSVLKAMGYTKKRGRGRSRLPAGIPKRDLSGLDYDLMDAGNVHCTLQNEI